MVPSPSPTYVVVQGFGDGLAARAAEWEEIVRNAFVLGAVFGSFVLFLVAALLVSAALRRTS